MLLQTSEVSRHHWHRRLRIKCIVTVASRNSAIRYSSNIHYKKYSLPRTRGTQIASIGGNHTYISAVNCVCKRCYRREIKGHIIIHHPAVRELEICLTSHTYEVVVTSLMALLRHRMVLSPYFAVSEKLRKISVIYLAEGESHNFLYWSGRGRESNAFASNRHPSPDTRPAWRASAAVMTSALPATCNAERARVRPV